MFLYNQYYTRTLRCMQILHVCMHLEPSGYSTLECTRKLAPAATASASSFGRRILYIRAPSAWKTPWLMLETPWLEEKSLVGKFDSSFPDSLEQADEKGCVSRSIWRRCFHVFPSFPTFPVLRLHCTLPVERAEIYIPLSQLACNNACTKNWKFLTNIHEPKPTQILQDLRLAKYSPNSLFNVH